MTSDPSNSTVSNRATRSSVSALLIVGLLLGVTIGAVQPGMRALHRDAAAELHATRQIAQTLARAVRELTGSDIHKPAIRIATTIPVCDESARRSAIAATQVSSQVPLLLEELIALPPPLA